MKNLIKITAFTILCFGTGFYLGQISTKSQIIHKVLENKKDCYDLIDLYNIINK